MARLNLQTKLTDHDRLYEMLIDLHDGCSEAESKNRNAKLILILCNHIGDEAVIGEALSLVKSSQMGIVSGK